VSHRDKLLGAFGNEPADLEANRRGRLGPGQARRMLRSGWNNIVAALFGGLVLAAILIFVADRPLKPAQWITSLILFGALLATAIFYQKKVRAAVARGEVETFIGPVVVQMIHGGYAIDTGMGVFKLPVRPWNVKSGEKYRVYVAQPSRVVVGMEPEGWD
jgi:hypothetical protein